MYDGPMTYPLETYKYNGLYIPMEIFKPITDEMVPNVLPIYWVSNIGNIYNTRINKFSNVKVQPHPKYTHVTLTLKDHSQVSANIHRLVCMAFHGMPTAEKPIVDHINCDKSCNYEGNLEWVSHQENIDRAYNKDRLHLGQDCYRSILTDEDIHYICKLIKEGKCVSEISLIMEERIYPKVYSSGFRGLIYHMMRGDCWKSIVSQYDLPDYSTFSM